MKLNKRKCKEILFKSKKVINNNKIYKIMLKYNICRNRK